MAEVDLSDATLIGHRDCYAETSRERAAVARRTADALKRNDSAEAKEAADRMSGVAPRETAIVAAINAYCSGAP